MNIEHTLKKWIIDGVQTLYDVKIEHAQVLTSLTRKEFEGHFTLMVFPLTKLTKKSPEQTADDLGKYLLNVSESIVKYNVVKGFLNISFSDETFKSFLNYLLATPDFATAAKNGEKVIVEYSSPNTNKPLHLGHIRNNLLGYSVAAILEKAGYEVIKTQVINDRGIHICKSMYAWKYFSNGETPASSGKKGDHLVGEYYVRFEKEFQKEYQSWQVSEAANRFFQTWLANPSTAKIMKGYKEKIETEEDFLQKYFFKEVFKNEYFNKYSGMGLGVKAMLLAWEAEDKEVLELWNTMNEWVYKGFDETYQSLGVRFDKNYYESNTYLLGKDIIMKGLENGAFYQKEDSSIWVDLRDVKLDEKILLRSDGTSIYITQDIGMAGMRYEDYKMNKMIYVVGDEQDYHFKVLFEILKRLKEPYAAGLHHLSYGMVDLPTGKMKSREGTVVDADDLIQELIEEVANESRERETLDSLSQEAQTEIWRKVALGALKFFMLKIEPKKRMTYNPKESLDFQGQTGPYIQNAFVRTQAVARKAGDTAIDTANEYALLEGIEKEIILHIHHYPFVLQSAATNYAPSEIANYVYDLARMYHKFWDSTPMLSAPAPAKAFRLLLSKVVARILEDAAALLGIEMPERM